MIQVTWRGRLFLEGATKEDERGGERGRLNVGCMTERKERREENKVGGRKW